MINFSRFSRTTNELGSLGDPTTIYSNLISLYCEPHRTYHNLDHISNCLSEFDSVKDLLENPHETELALWFHDAIYDTKAKNNEEESAELAVLSMQSLGISNDKAQRVQKLILLTKHNAIPAETDECFIVDMDLVIFGYSPDKYDEYEKQIKLEYRWVRHKLFCEARFKLLRSFLDRKWIYSTDYYRRRYETIARDNLKRALEGLK